MMKDVKPFESLSVQEVLSIIWNPTAPCSIPHGLYRDVDAIRDATLETIWDWYRQTLLLDAIKKGEWKFEGDNLVRVDEVPDELEKFFTWMRNGAFGTDEMCAYKFYREWINKYRSSTPTTKRDEV